MNGHIPKQLFLRWHLGLGDAILCNGLVRCLLGNYDSVTVTAKKHNSESVRFMFFDDDRILVLEGDDTASDKLAFYHEGILKSIGSFGKNWNPEQWDVCFYDQAGIEREERWNSFRVPHCTSRLFPNIISKFAFLHPRSSDGSTIDRYEVRKEAKCTIIDVTDWNEDAVLRKPLPTIFHWMDVLREASQIYCIDSAFSCLVDCMPDLKATKFVLYHKPKSVSPYGPPTLLKKPWEHRYL